MHLALVASLQCVENLALSRLDNLEGDKSDFLIYNILMKFRNKSRNYCIDFLSQFV